MLKRKVLLGILFILGISLLNVAVLIEASNQESQLFVDPSEQQPIPATGKVLFKRCNTASGSCSISDNNYDCWELSNGKCTDAAR